MPESEQPVSTGDLSATLVDSVDAVEPQQWNRLAGTAYPFTRHEHLAAMERHGCVGEDSGWIPRHVLVYEDDQLVAASPGYIKLHSQGEFVFDWAWADAYQRNGLDYYPKLVSCIPFTPSGGPRLLVGDRPDADRLRHALVSAAVGLSGEMKLSSCHWLFTEDDDTRAIRDCGLLVRTGSQFHWTNPGYRDFDDFLDTLTAKRRKEIRRERRDAANAPVEVEVLTGAEASDTQWSAYHRLYSSTYDRKWGYPALTPGFFRELGETMPENIILVLGRREGRYIAGAHCFQGEHTLYGRNWGCSEQHRGLHFEICYYTLIEWCIAHGLTRFDAGAQGEHKITRGFLPVQTYSGHWISDERFREAIGRFLDEETREIGRYVSAMSRHSPFREASVD